MPILVKSDDVRSGRKAKGRHGPLWRLGSQWLKQGEQYMIASFSFALTAHVTQWSNYLTQRAEILTRRSNLTPKQAKNTVNDLSVVTLWCLWYRSRFRQVGFAVSSLIFPRPASCGRQFTPNGSNFG